MVWCCDEVKFVLLVEFCLKWEYHDFLEDRFGNRKGRKWQFHISIRICENKTIVESIIKIKNITQTLFVSSMQSVYFISSSLF